MGIKSKRKTQVRKSSKKQKKVIVQSVWVGSSLSRMEQYSIKSFLTLGFEYHLYVS